MNLDLENLINSVGSARRSRASVSSAASASQQLKKWWIAERMAPLLLEYQESLLSTIVAEIRRLRDHIEETSLLLLEDDANITQQMGDVKIELLVVETELERVKYIARAYKRTRMAKIDRHLYYYLQKQTETENPNERLMSKDEWIYCHRHAELLADHYHLSFLGSLPEELQDLTDQSGHIPMIEEPDLNQPVTVRVTGDLPGDGIVDVAGEAVQLEKGNIYLSRFSVVAGLGELRVPYLIMSRAIIYSPRQVGNPLLKTVPDVPLEQGDKSMKPDFLIAERCCALFLSMRYNNLHPEYIYKRIENLGRMYESRILLVHADVENPTDSLTMLTKLCVRRDLALIVVWSYEEAGIYLSSLKRKYRAVNNNNTTLNIQKKQGTSHADQLVEVLTKVPRVNKPDILGLAAKFHTFKDIVANSGSVEQLEGWGPTKSSKFKRALNEPFTGVNPLSQ